MLKILRRYSIVSTLILACFISAFFALYNGLLTTLEKTRLLKSELQNTYSQEIAVTITSQTDFTMQTLFSLIQDVQSANIMLDNMLIYFSEVDGVYCPEIILKQNESMKILENKAIQEIPEQAIIAPKSLVGKLQELGTFESKLSVHMILDDNKYPFYKGLFILNGEDYFNLFPSALENNKQITINLKSNENKSFEALQQIQNNGEKLGSNFIINSKDISPRESLYRGTINEEGLISGGLFLFAILNTMIISYYWVVVRKREIAIRKAFGATNMDVIQLLTKELLQLVGTAAFLSVVIQSILLFRKLGEMSRVEAIQLMCIFLLFMIIGVMVAMIIPVRYILRIQPAEGVKS